MARNLLGRVEVVAPVEDKQAREKIWESLQTMLSDRRQTWDMNAQGDYRLRQPQNPAEELGVHDLLAEKSRLKSLVFKMEELKN
jgi:polyphosphate kinase